MSSVISKLLETASAPPLLCLMFLPDSCGPLGHHSGNLRVERRGLWRVIRFGGRSHSKIRSRVYIFVARVLANFELLSSELGSVS